jgi:hypothetical protein
VVAPSLGKITNIDKKMFSYILEDFIYKWIEENVERFPSQKVGSNQTIMW